MRIYAFQGFRYSGRAGSAGELAAPPFDQIHETLRAELQGRSPHHFAHLTRPVSDDGDPHAAAARLHRAWLRAEVVERDDTPALYPYAIELAGGGRRPGLCALVGVEPPDSPAIRPHEQTLDKPFADRLALLRATAVDLEPIMLMSQDGGELEALLEEDTAGAEPLASHRDAAGHRHLLYRVTDPARVARYRAVLGACPVAIADGHHRYKVARAYAEEMGAEAGTAAASKMAVVFSLASEELAIHPIHRGLAEARDLAPLHALITERRPWQPSGGEKPGEEFARAVAAATQPALGVGTAEKAEIWRLDPERAPAGTPPGAEGMSVLLLHRLLLPAVGLDSKAFGDGTVTYRADPQTLYDEVRRGELAQGFWLPPMEPAAFAAAIAGGDLLPAKSTRFMPKLASGLVWAGHDARLA